MGTDGSIPMALDYAARMHEDGLPAPLRPEQLVFALDHYGPASGKAALALQQRARDYARCHGVPLYDAGAGISHQLVLESGSVAPGQLAVGADSHSVSYGAVNAFATGIGSSDLAGILLCGQVWLKVPPTLRVRFTGPLSVGVTAKDVALCLARQLGADGASYHALEFTGPGAAGLDMDDRIVLSNMSVEVGAKAGIFGYDAVTAAWLARRTSDPFEPVHADADAVYADTVELNLSEVVPQLAMPHRVDNVVDLADAPPTRVDIVYLGTCTGGRVKDYHEALQALMQGGGIASGVQVIVTPASMAVQEALAGDGTLAAFVQLGALIQPPGCGSCCGTCGMVPGDGANVISTANRNFKGRMGNANAAIFLASPRECAIAATRGEFGRIERAQ